MDFMEMSRRGPALFIRPEMVAAIRTPRAGEAGESIIVLASGAEIACGYDAGHARARLSRDWPAHVEPPPFDDGLNIDDKTREKLERAMEIGERIAAAG